MIDIERVNFSRTKLLLLVNEEITIKRNLKITKINSLTQKEYESKYNEIIINIKTENYDNNKMKRSGVCCCMYDSKENEDKFFYQNEIL